MHTAAGESPDKAIDDLDSWLVSPILASEVAAERRLLRGM